MKKVMIVGLGELGSNVYQLLLNSGAPLKIVTADVNEDTGIRKTNLMKYVAGQMGIDREVEFVKVDLFNIDETASTIDIVDPDIIYSAATLQSWLLRLFPKKFLTSLTKRVLVPGFPCI